MPPPSISKRGPSLPRRPRSEWSPPVRMAWETRRAPAGTTVTEQRAFCSALGLRSRRPAACGGAGGPQLGWQQGFFLPGSGKVSGSSGQESSLGWRWRFSLAHQLLPWPPPNPQAPGQGRGLHTADPGGRSIWGGAVLAAVGAAPGRPDEVSGRRPLEGESLARTAAQSHVCSRPSAKPHVTDGAFFQVEQKPNGDQRCHLQGPSVKRMSSRACGETGGRSKPSWAVYATVWKTHG